MSQFIRHEACPVCGSSDNVSVYWNEQLLGYTWHCETPGCTHSKTDRMLAMEKSAVKLDGTPLSPELIKRFQVTKDAAAKYGVLNDGEKIIFPYTNQFGIVIDAKVRNYGLAKSAEGHFFWLQSGIHNRPLFGMAACAGKKALIITEGEWDAVAANIMMGWNAVSIPCGAKSALKFIKAHYAWLDQFEVIYVCFDNDLDGQAASLDVAEFIGPKALHVTLPKYITTQDKPPTKDSYDYLAGGLIDQYKSAIWSATKQVPKYILKHEDFVSRAKDFLYNPLRRTGYSTGIPELDEIVGGFRLGEISTLLAAPGRGKSSFARFCIRSLMAQDAKCLYITLEEQPEIAEVRLLELLVSEKLIHNPPSPEYFEQLAENIRDKVVMADISGALDLDMLGKIVLYAVKQEDIKFVLLDHITAAVSGDEMVWRSIQIMMDKLNQLAQSLSIHICIISHTTRRTKDKDTDEDDPVPSISDAFGGSGIEQYTHAQLAIRRMKNNLIQVYVLKNRLWGKLGKVLLEYDNGNYEVVDSGETAVHRKQGDSTRGTGRQLVRGQASHPASGQGLETEHGEIHSLPQATNADTECSPARETTTECDGAAPLPGDEPGTRLHPAKRDTSGDERGDDRPVSYQGTPVDGATPNYLFSLSSCLSECKTNRPQIASQLRDVGEFDEYYMVSGHHSFRMVSGGDTEAEDDNARPIIPLDPIFL